MLSSWKMAMDGPTPRAMIKSTICTACERTIVWRLVRSPRVVASTTEEEEEKGDEKDDGEDTEDEDEADDEDDDDEDEEASGRPPMTPSRAGTTPHSEIKLEPTPPSLCIWTMTKRRPSTPPAHCSCMSSSAATVVAELAAPTAPGAAPGEFVPSSVGTQERA